MNIVVMSGRLTRKPETRKTNSGKSVASFSIAVDNIYATASDQKTDFFDIVAWEKKAEFAEKYLDKGRKVIVSGRLQNRSWKANDGSTRKSTEIIADQIEFADSKQASINVEPPPANFDVIPDDDTLPF